MSQPFLGQIIMVGFNFPPRGWAFCDGQILPINQNQALFSILGTTYGGDGQTTFALPDLRGRTPLHAGSGAGLTPRQIGQRAGEQTHTLSVQEIPAHTHTAQGSSQSAQLTSAANAVWANSGGASGFSSTHDGVMDTSAVSSAGGSQAHENMQPFLTVSFVIALQGIFPSRN